MYSFQDPEDQGSALRKVECQDSSHGFGKSTIVHSLKMNAPLTRKVNNVHSQKLKIVTLVTSRNWKVNYARP